MYSDDRYWLPLAAVGALIVGMRARYVRAEAWIAKLICVFSTFLQLF